jgi:hypothetical protein
MKGTAACMAAKAIVFLDGTGCRLTYRPAERSEQSHLREQDACLQQSGYPKELEGFTVQCLRAELPDDWTMVTPAIERELGLQLVEAGVKRAEAEAQSACYAGMVTVALNQSGCPLIDRKALRLEELVRSHQRCAEQADLKGELERFMRTCTRGKFPVAAGQPGAGATATTAPKVDLSASLQGIVPLQGKHCPLDYHRRGEVCLHSELLSLEPKMLESIVRSFQQGGPVPMVKEK